MPEAKPATTKRAPSTRKRTTATTAAKPRTRSRKPALPTMPTYDQIAERAYFIAMDGGSDEVSNWLRAERELTAA